MNAWLVGNIGARLDIKVKVGTTVGPFLLKFVQPDNTYFNFGGYTLRAKARTRGASPVAVAMTASFADPTGFPGADWTMGQAILLGATKQESAKLEAPATTTAVPKISDWDFEVEAPDGTLYTLLYGEIRSYLRLVTA
jgi:hypothetical protein